MLAIGDRLQGRLLSHEAGSIRWENPVLGTITVDESKATVVPDSVALPVSPQQTPPMADTANSQSQLITRQTSGAKPATAKPSWKTTIESSLSLQSGRSDRADINLRAESTYQLRRNTFRT
mgnify:CR=1 FL=1